MVAKSVAVHCNGKSMNISSTTSAISFHGSLVLVYGIIFSPLLEKKHRKWLELVLDKLDFGLKYIPEFDQLFNFTVIDEEENEELLYEHYRRPGRKMAVAGAWICPLVKSGFDLVLKDLTDYSESQYSATLLSTFMFLKIPGTSCPNVRLSDIMTILSEPARGQGVILEYKLKSLLVNTLSRGIVGCVFGPNGCLFLTDASTTNDSNGGPIFSADSDRPVDTVKGPLLGLIASHSEKGKFTAGIALIPVLRRLFPPVGYHNIYPWRVPSIYLRDLVDETMVIISCGLSRGSGVVLDASSGVIITCSHVVSDSTSGVKVIHKGKVYSSELIYKTPNDLEYDLAIVRVVTPNSFSQQMTISDKPCIDGEIVYSASFPHIPSLEKINVKPMISLGCISKSHPFQIQTTCHIVNGSSGGAIIRNGELLGIIVCIIVVDKEICPRFNLSVPATAFAQYVKEYISTGNVNCLQKLQSSDENVQRVWKMFNE